MSVFMFVTSVFTMLYNVSMYKPQFFLIFPGKGWKKFMTLSKGQSPSQNLLTQLVTLFKMTSVILLLLFSPLREDLLMLENLQNL